MTCRHLWYTNHWSAYRLMRSVCVDCGHWLSLGPSNDEPVDVQIEIRAAEIVAGGLIDPHAMSLAFAHGWNNHVSRYLGELKLCHTDEWFVGYLAHAIVAHDEEDQ